MRKHHGRESLDVVGDDEVPFEGRSTCTRHPQDREHPAGRQPQRQAGVTAGGVSDGEEVRAQGAGSMHTVDPVRHLLHDRRVDHRLDVVHRLSCSPGS